MAWTYNNTTFVLQSTGATEASPDSLLAGIAIVQAADATRGYRNVNSAWLNNVEIQYAGSWIVFDNFSLIAFYGSTYLREGAGGWIGGAMATLDIRVTTSRTDAAASVGTGGSIITRKLRPQDPDFTILYNQGVRYDFPTILSNRTPNKIDIDGLSLYGNAGSAFWKVYFGRATNFVKAKGVKKFGTTGGLQYAYTTYDDLYNEALGMEGEGANTDVIFNRPVFYTASPVSINGSIRGGRVAMNNPTFLNNAWNRTINFLSDRNAGSIFSGAYDFRSFIKSGLTNLQGVNVRFTRARQSLIGTSTWTAPNDTLTATTDVNGTFTAVRLFDWYSAGTTTTSIEFFNWTLKARKYDKKTPAENVFNNRVLYQHSVNMSAGYGEEIQMLDVPFITLTQAQALALTGITFAPSGATSGTITNAENKTVAEMWQSYRAWISQTANFGSEDTWTFDGVTLNTGAWNVVNNAIITGSIRTTGTVTGTGSATGTVTDSTGTNVVTRTSDNLALSTEILIDGVPQGWVVGNVARTIKVQSNTVVRIYAHAYGYQPKIINVTGNTASDYIISLVPETNVNTALSSATRDTIAAAFAVGVDGFSRLFLSVNTDLRQYSPADTMNALHYFTVTQGSMIALAAISANSVDGFALIDGGFIIRSAGFYGKVADSVTTPTALGILVPLYIQVDPSVYVAMPTYTPVELNTSGLVLQYAPWTQQTDLSLVAKEATLLQSEADIIAAIGSGGGGSGGSGLTLAQIEASTVLAKEATVASRASQVSVNAIPTNTVLANDARLNNLDTPISTRSTLTAPQVRTELATELSRLDVAISTRLAASGYVAPDNANIQATKAKVDTLNNYNDATLQSRVDAIKAKTDQLIFTAGNVNAIAQVVSDKTGYSLTTAERTAIAVAVEQAILNDGDGQAILNAIVGAIGNQNIDQLALVAAIRADIERSGGMLESLPTIAEINSSAALAKTSDVIASKNEVISEINANELKIDAIKADVEVLENADFTITNNKIDAVKTKVDTIENADLSRVAKTSELPTDYLKAVDYTAPDNQKIALIKEKVDSIENYNDADLTDKLRTINNGVKLASNFKKHKTDI